MKMNNKEFIMKKWLIGLLIGLGALGLGVGSAFAAHALIPTVKKTALNQNLQQYMGPGMGQRFGDRQDQYNGQLPGKQGRGDNNQPYSQNMPGGMYNKGMNQQGYNQVAPSTERISVDDAYTNAQEYVTMLGSNLKIAEVMEFQNNFYIAVTESDTGRGAVELLVDPYTGEVSREMGAGTMWNLKYGRMGMMAGTATDSTLTLDEARQAAQASLDQSEPGAMLDEGGYSFYGYYTFDYSIDGATAGMLSVNGLTGQVLVHNWHGTLISEKEF
jgi:hypothetical protein